MQNNIARCPLCGKEADSFLRNIVKLGTKYSLYSCSYCYIEFWELRFIDPKFYSDWSAQLAPIGKHNVQLWHFPFFKNFPITEGKLLDVGCGDGAFLEELIKNRFTDVYGVDFDEVAVQSCKNNRGINNVCSDSLEEYSKYSKNSENTFDVITFFEVLEHQEKLDCFFDRIKQLLRDSNKARRMALLIKEET